MGSGTQGRMFLMKLLSKTLKQISETQFGAHKWKSWPLCWSEITNKQTKFGFFVNSGNEMGREDIVQASRILNSTGYLTRHLIMYLWKTVLD